MSERAQRARRVAIVSTGSFLLVLLCGAPAALAQEAAAGGADVETKTSAQREAPAAKPAEVRVETPTVDEIVPPPMRRARVVEDIRVSDPVRASGPAVTLGFSGLLLSRSASLWGTTQTIEHQPNTYRGGALEVDVELLPFRRGDGHVWLRLGGQYAAARNADVAPELGWAPVTEHTQGAARAGATHYLSALDLSWGLGVQATSFTVEPNNTYTGHRYIAASLLVGASRGFAEELIRVGAELDVLPALSVNESDGARGDVNALGGRLAARVAIRLLRDATLPTQPRATLELRYTFQRWHGWYADGGAVEEANDDGSAETIRPDSSTDQQHTLGLALRYTL